MKNSTTSKLFILCLALIYLSSCATDEIILENPDPIIFPDPVELLSTSLLGSVEDEAGIPIEGAVVICQNCLPLQETLTDERGDFQFIDIEVKGGSAFISVSSDGRFDGYRRYALLEDRYNYTRILLKEKLALGTLQASDGGELIADDGASITLPANGIVDASGQSYTGEYEVFLSWIDPSSADLNLTMMGDLSGISSDNEQVGLSTYGMLQIELESPDGFPLNLGEETMATLEFPLPESLRATAPAEIPLWSYNEEKGYWVEEGSAILVGNKYIGDVSHFSTWNVDVKIDPVDICGNIIAISRDQEVDLSYFQINLSGDSFQSVGGWLCEDGSFRFRNVPSGEVLTLEVTNYCGEVVKFIELGPLDPGKEELDPIIISTSTELTFVDISGNAVNCDGDPVVDGILGVELEFDTYSFPLKPDGSFNFKIPTCETFSASIQIIDKDPVGFTTSLPIVLTEKSENLALENLEVCDEVPEEYLFYSYFDAVNDIKQERYFFDEVTLSYLKFGQEYNLQTDFTVFDGIIIIVSDAPSVGPSQLGEAVILFETMPVVALSDVEVEYTEIGAETSPGEFEFLKGHFNKSDVLQGGFSLKK